MFRGKKRAGGPTTTNGHSWEIPLLGKYRFKLPTVQPFVGGGVTLGSTINTQGVRQPDASPFYGSSVTTIC